MDVENNNFAYLNKENTNNLEKDDSKFAKICSLALSDIQLEKLSVLKLVELLGEFLTNQSYSRRELGLLILTDVLQNLHKDFLTSEQLEVLATYFSEKLKDHHQLIPTVLKGILALVKCSNTPSRSIIFLLTSIFQHIVCQQQQQQDRYTIFQIYELVLRKYPLDIKNMGPDFVYGIISSIDGERDPKNLLYLFTWLPSFMQTVPLGHLSEEMFEVLACYFPVDFKAPPSDTNKITRQDLSDALCLCLTAVEEFGEYGIPLALEKFESALNIAKEDSLTLLKKGCENYSITIYTQHAVEIWSQLQREILVGINDPLKEQCLETFTTVVDKLSEEDEQEYVSFLNNIIDSLKGNLIPDSKLFLASISILNCVAKANSKSSLFVCNKILPLLENTYSITKNTKHKKVLLNNFMKLIECFLKHNRNTELSECEEIANAIAICVEAIRGVDDELKMEGYNGITILVKWLPENVRELVIGHLIKIISEDKLLKSSKFKCLEQMAVHYPEEIKTRILQKEEIKDNAELDSYLEILCTLSHLPYFEDFVVEVLLKYTLSDIKQIPVALNHINNILGKVENIGFNFERNNFIEKFMEFLVQQEDLLVLDENFLLNSSSVLTTLVRRKSSEEQIQTFLTLSQQNFKFEQVYVTLLSGIVVPFHQNALTGTINIARILKYCYNSDVFIKNTSLKVLSSVINKLNHESILHENLSLLKESCCHHKMTVPELDVIIWTTKALVMRNHPQAYVWTDYLLDLLDSHAEICEGFHIIMNDNYPELSRENFSNVMPLYRQKFFIYCTNTLAERFSSGKNTYLIAIAYLIEFAPKMAIIAQFKKIHKLILLSLEQCSEPKILEIILERIQDFIGTKESIIGDNLEDFLLRVLNLTTYDLSMKVRIAALRCLQKFVQSYEVYKLLPLKDKVIKHLGICIDDKKRLVRKEATDTRSLWFVLDAVF